MKNNLSEKALYLITILLFGVSFFLVFILASKKAGFSFFVFLLIYWQRKRLQGFFQKIQNPKVSDVIFILIGWLGAIFLELSLRLSPFHPKPVANYLIGLGFYLPYFAIWQLLIKRYRFTFLEIFYLSGLGKIFFDLLITRKLLIAASVATSALSSFLIFLSQAAVTLTLFGMLTSLPALFLPLKEGDHHQSLPHYLIGLASNFFAAGIFVVWTIILKAIFTP